MRLAELLSKPIKNQFEQIEGFLDGKKLKFGQQQKIEVGNVGLTFFCKECNDHRTFYSDGPLFCIIITKRLISIDCVVKCPCCESFVPVWFLVVCDDDFSERFINARILKRSNKLLEKVLIEKDKYEDFSEALEKAKRAYHEGLGAGSIIYLRKILEKITIKTANIAGINPRTEKNRRKTFESLLKEVNEQCSIIPNEFTTNGYRLFSELSEVIHGDYDEQLALQKFDSFHRLVIGVLDNVKNSREIGCAINLLGWNDEVIKNE